MSFDKTLLPGLLVVAAIAAAAWALRPSAVAEGSSSMAGPATATTHPTLPSGSAGIESSPISADSVRRQPANPLREPPTQADLLARVDDHIRTLDARFIAEPLDGAWAGAQERGIRDFFQPAQLLAHGLAAPTDVSTRCHSRTCRITAYYADPAMAEQSMQQLALRLVDALPYGAVMPRQLPGGQVEVNAWYSSQAFTP